MYVIRKKVDKSANFAAAGFSVAGHIITHSAESRANTKRPDI
jgi:hypothetical protein